MILGDLNLRRCSCYVINYIIHMGAPLIFIGLAASIAIAATHKPKQDYIPPDPPPPEDVHHYREGHRLSDLQVQYSSYGKVIPLIYGTVRLAGNVIWSRPILETQLDTTTSNSGNRNTIYTHHKNYTYSATLARGQLLAYRAYGLSQSRLICQSSTTRFI